MPAMRVSLSQATDEVCKRLQGSDIGSVRVVHSDCRLEDEPDGTVRAYFELTLADPAQGEDTWRVDDVLELQNAVDRAAVDAELNVPWEVALRRESLEQYDEDPLNEG